MLLTANLTASFLVPRGQGQPSAPHNAYDIQHFRLGAAVSEWVVLLWREGQDSSDE